MKIAVDGQVKDDKVAPRSCDFKANANGPDVLRFERFFLTDEQSLIPREVTDSLLETRLVITTWLVTYSSHGLNSGTPNAAKSLTLRVTSVRSLASAGCPKETVHNRQRNAASAALCHVTAPNPTARWVGCARSPRHFLGIGVCTENLIRVDDVMESPKLAE